jgi:hypothetical protein
MELQASQVDGQTVQRYSKGSRAIRDCRSDSCCSAQGNSSHVFSTDAGFDPTCAFDSLESLG